MISFLQIDNLSKSVGDRLLFSDFTLGVYQGDKIGIVAPNGSGKTTLLNILSGSDDYDDGRVVFRNDLRIAYLSQNIEIDGELTVLDYLLKNPLLHEEDNNIDKAKKFLSLFNISDFKTQIKYLSGGQLKRVELAKVLMPDPEFLILDEPTNHLDIEMVEWLEDYLRRSNVTFLMVTHDRYFLDNICNKIIEIDDRQFFAYDGNFNYYLTKREERHEAQNAERLRIKNILRKELDWMRRQPQARATKSKSRIDNFYQLKEKVEGRNRDDKVNLGKGASYIGNKIFEAVNVSKSFGDVKILDNWNYVFSRYEKVGIIGPNGAGKTTFIKLLLNELNPDSGRFDIGSTVKWGYYSQEGYVNFDENKKVIDAVKEVCENVQMEDNKVLSASQFLSKFLFPPDTQQKYIHKLSGGEKRRLNLALTLIKKPNFLILDEPTNDLDIMTLSVLEDYLVDFKGCLIIVSHDRFFLDRTVDHLFVFKGNAEIKDFPGNYSDYREFQRLEEKEKKAESGSFNQGKSKDYKQNKEKPNNKLTFKEKRELEQLEMEIKDLYVEKDNIEKEMNGGVNDHLRLEELAQTYKILSEKIDESELRILELMEKEA